MLHQTHCNNFRVTEILVVLSGDFHRYFRFSLFMRNTNKLLIVIKLMRGNNSVNNSNVLHMQFVTLKLMTEGINPSAQTEHRRLIHTMGYKYKDSGIARCRVSHDWCTLGSPALYIGTKKRRLFSARNVVHHQNGP